MEILKRNTILDLITLIALLPLTAIAVSFLLEVTMGMSAIATIAVLFPKTKHPVLQNITLVPFPLLAPCASIAALWFSLITGIRQIKKSKTTSLLVVSVLLIGIPVEIWLIYRIWGFFDLVAIFLTLLPILLSLYNVVRILTDWDIPSIKKD